MPANDPGWHPDPAGRHQYRWWDGSNWTDQVADNDVTSTDPLAGGTADGGDEAAGGTAGGAAAAGAAGGAVAGAVAGAEPTPPPTEVTPQPAQPAQPPTTVTPQPVAAQAMPPTEAAPLDGPPVSDGDKSKLPIFIGAGIAVVVIAAAAFFLLGGDSESDGTGEFTASIEGDDGVFTQEVTAKTGDAFGVKVETTAPSNLRGGSGSDLDPVLVIAAADAETADAINEFESDELGSEDPEAEHEANADLLNENTNVRVDGEVFGIRDDQGEGEGEDFGLTFPVAGTFNISVAGFEDTEGDIKVTIAKQSTTEDIGDNPSADDIDDLTTGEHEGFLSGFTDDPVIFGDIAEPDPEPDQLPEPDPVPPPDPEPDPTPDGGGLEEEAIDLLTTELVNSAGLSQVDAECVSRSIIDTIGVAGLAEIGLAAGEDGEFTDLSEQQQTDLFDLIQASFDGCGVIAN